MMCNLVTPGLFLAFGRKNVCHFHKCLDIVCKTKLLTKDYTRFVQLHSEYKNRRINFYGIHETFQTFRMDQLPVTLNTESIGIMVDYC